MLPVEYSVVKRHKWSPKIAKDKLSVVTFRNPLDVIVSSIQRFESTPITLSVIDHHINTANENGFNSLLDPRIRHESLMLRYEDFYQNNSFLIFELQGYFSLEFEEDKVAQILDRFEINNVNKNIASWFQSFSQWDEETHFHGKHISPSLGTPGSHRLLFSKTQIQYIQLKLENVIDALSY